MFFFSDGILQTAALIENLAQTAAANVGYLAKINNIKPKLGFIGAIKKFKSNLLPKLGDILESKITVENQIIDFTVVQGEVYLNKDLIASCELRIFLKDY